MSVWTSPEWDCLPSQEHLRLDDLDLLQAFDLSEPVCEPSSSSPSSSSAAAAASETAALVGRESWNAKESGVSFCESTTMMTTTMTSAMMTTSSSSTSASTAASAVVGGGSWSAKEASVRFCESTTMFTTTMTTTMTSPMMTSSTSTSSELSADPQAGFCLDFLDCQGDKDFLDSDFVMRQHSEDMDEDYLPSLTDNDWFINSIFGEGSDVVYNDKNLGETASSASSSSASSSSSSQPPCIKSEHSYSSNTPSPSSPHLSLPSVKEEPDLGVFSGQGCTGGPQQLLTSADPSTPSTHTPTSTPTPTTTTIKCESPDPCSDPLLSAMITSDITPPTCLPPPHTPTTPTIILATTSTPSPSCSSSSSSSLLHTGFGTQIVFPSTYSSSSSPTTLHIKTQPVSEILEQTVNVDSLLLPPTPPSSNGSDSDGSQSPQRSAPNSPHRQSPMPQSGMLILTEEEKRTLISEGYPVPTKLPLSKQEEKNLKKVRRKIKNKISAQESRRKKKEYVEQLEKRVEAYNHENCDLKRKVDALQSDNRSLLGQLQRLQALLTKGTKTAAASATQTGTVLMVLMLCFAVFLGGSGLSSLNVGYHRSPPGSGVSPPGPQLFSSPLQQLPAPLKVQPYMGPGAPRPAPDAADDYTTPNLKSRVLMAFSKEDPEDWCDEYRPLVSGEDHSCHPHLAPCPDPAHDLHPGPADPGVDRVMPTVTFKEAEVEGQQSVAVVTIAVARGVENGTAPEVGGKVDVGTAQELQALMHPDIAVAPNLGRANVTADLETA